MRSNLFIKYKTKEDGGFDLTTIGESFIGMDSNLKDLFELSGIDGELILKTEKISEGTISAHQIIQVATTFPFHDVQCLLDFLYVVREAEYKAAVGFFQALSNGYKTVNDFVRENPLVLVPLEPLVSTYFKKLIAAAKFQKNGPRSDESVGNIPMRYAKGLHRMIVDKKFKRTLRPIVEESATEIIISNKADYSDASRIDGSNFENYLPEEEKILPEFENGAVCDLSGELLAIQSTKGEVLRFRIHNIDERFSLLIAFPADGKSTENYIQYYKRAVNIKARILRDSLYKRPELQLINIELIQQDMFEQRA